MIDRYPWLDKLPASWNVANLGHIAIVETGSADVQDSIEAGTFPFFVRSDQILRLDSYTHDTEAVLTAGDGRVGEIFHHVNGKFAAHQRVYVIQPGRFLTGRYLFYAMKAHFGPSLAGTTAKSTVESLRRPMLTSFQVAFPPLDEQTLIADYLDRETAEIDAFIEDHERLLQLLDERSAVAIETAVLGAGAATTVDTGQSWPATLPLGWTAQRVSWLFDATGSGTTPASDDADAFDGDIPWVTTGELREKAITSSGKKVSLETLRQYSALRVHPAGSLLIAMYGATIGRLGWLEVPATVNQAVCVMSGYKAGPLRFPYYALLAARPYLLTLASGGGQPNINQDKIRSLRLPVPPSAEQERIVAELDHTLEAEYALRRDVERSIELARERRSALISEAVTGQIDATAQGVSAADHLRDELEVHV